jgi:hypothetical protein
MEQVILQGVMLHFFGISIKDFDVRPLWFLLTAPFT